MPCAEGTSAPILRSSCSMSRSSKKGSLGSISVVPTQSPIAPRLTPQQARQAESSSASPRKCCRNELLPSGVGHGAAPPPGRTPHVSFGHDRPVSMDTPQLPTSK